MNEPGICLRRCRQDFCDKKMFPKIEQSIWQDLTSTICTHCANPISIFQNEIKFQQEENSHSSQVKEALTKIFKLNYLNPTHNLPDDEIDQQLLSLCPNCTLQLTQLFQLYTEFLQLGQNSYFISQLTRLDEILTAHQRTINFLHPLEDPDDDYIPNDEDGDSCSDIKPINKIAPPTTHPELNGREIKIVLTRLTESELKNTRNPHQKLSPVSTPKKRLHRSKKELERRKSGKINSKEKLTTEYLQRRFAIYLNKRTKFENPCWYCKQHFATSLECQDHTRNVHIPELTLSAQSEVTVCQRCSKICPNDRLSIHMEKCETISVGLLAKSFQCSICPKFYGTPRGVKAHMATHSEERPFGCDECPYTAKFKSSVRTHKRYVHKKVDDDFVQEKWECDECKLSLKNERQLKYHKKIKHTLEGYQKYRKFQVKANIRKRMKTAQRGPPTTFCEDCQINFYSRLAFLNHRRGFHAESFGQFTCDQCGATFAKADTLQRHINGVHSEERPFLCTTCGKAFKFAKNLKDHVTRTHTEEGRLLNNQLTKERNHRRKLMASLLAGVIEGNNLNVGTSNEQSSNVKSSFT